MYVIMWKWGECVKKEISEINYLGKEILFDEAILYAGEEGGKKTYMLSISKPSSIPNIATSLEANITVTNNLEDLPSSLTFKVLTSEGEKAELVATLASETKDKSIYLVDGSPFQ
ncbi:hypothetical protein KP78_25200 [Jeotgalibacillus soli]|uniref:Uncharacterized protein n=2 Tax=Jeotgalibacillus soli TaxID=889306 RepID=A0A0C2VKJ3_9BACL|nr:hypothetical protein KP78_25200 [Jeotgalibacillus soli]